MTHAHVSVLPIHCELSLSVQTVQAESDGSGTAIDVNEPFTLSAHVDIQGPGAIAFLALSPVIAIEFYAKAIGLGDDIIMGQTTIPTMADTNSYCPTLTIEAPNKLGFEAGKFYRLGALMRIGAASFPGLIHGYVESLTAELYQLPTADSQIQDSSSSSLSTTQNHHTKKRSTSSAKPVK
jgi:hypothetical protein